jgi:hypothetical protein
MFSLQLPKLILELVALGVEETDLETEPEGQKRSSSDGLSLLFTALCAFFSFFNAFGRHALDPTELNQYIDQNDTMHHVVAFR